VSRPTRYVEEIELFAQTDLALLVGPEGYDEEDAVWIPRSTVEDTDLEDVGDVGFLEVQEWVADEKGLIS